MNTAIEMFLFLFIVFRFCVSNFVCVCVYLKHLEPIYLLTVLLSLRLCSSILQYLRKAVCTISFSSVTPLRWSDSRPREDNLVFPYSTLPIVLSPFSPAHYYSFFPPAAESLLLRKMTRLAPEGLLCRWGEGAGAPFLLLVFSPRPSGWVQRHTRCGLKWERRETKGVGKSITKCPLVADEYSLFQGPFLSREGSFWAHLKRRWPIRRQRERECVRRERVIEERERKKERDRK